MKKLQKITLNERVSEGEEGKSYYRDDACIQDNGQLNVSSFDFGPEVDRLWGHDYEYDIYVAKDWKDTLLLLLLKERFKNARGFREWCGEKSIPLVTTVW